MMEGYKIKSALPSRTFSTLHSNMYLFIFSGWVGIDVMLKFARLSKLSSEGDVILKALQKSEEKLIEVDLENKKVRRNPEMPLPEVEDDEAKKVKTIYLKGFEKTNTTLDDLLGMQEKTIKFLLKFLRNSN